MSRPTKCITPDDVTIGANLRTLRESAGMSQEKLGEHIGISFQQIQKYEKATNRVSLSMALKICRVLGVNVQDMTGGQNNHEEAHILNILREENTAMKKKLEGVRNALA